MSINSDHTAGSQPTPDHSPIHTMESDLQKFPSSRNIPLKITLYRLNKALSICQHLKIQILSDQNKNISKDKISSREHLLSKKLTYAREQLLGFQYDNIAIVQFYQDILLKTAPDLHHAIFVSYHDDLIGKHLGDTELSYTFLNQARVKSYLSYNSSSSNHQAQNTKNLVLQAFLKNKYPSKLYQQICLTSFAIFSCLLIGGVIAASKMNLHFPKRKNKDAKPLVINLPDARDYISFDLKNTRNIEDEPREINKRVENDQLVVDNPEHPYPQNDKPPPLTALLRNFDFSSRSLDINMSLLRLIRDQSKGQLSIPLQEQYESKASEYALYDDIFVFNFGPSSGVLGLHVSSGDKNRDILLNSSIHSNEQLEQVFTHEVGHGVFGSTGITAVDEGKTELRTQSFIRDTKQIDCFHGYHEYTPFVVQNYLIQKVYPHDQKAYIFMPYIRFLAQSDSSLPSHPLAGTIADIYWERPQFILPYHLQIFSSGGYATVSKLIKHDKSLSPNMRFFMGEQLIAYKNSIFYSYDTKSIAEKQHILQQRFKEHKDDPELTYSPPQTPNFQQSPAPIKNKKNHDNEFDIMHIISIATYIASILIFLGLLARYNSKGFIKKHAISYVLDRIKQTPATHEDVLKLLKDLQEEVSADPHGKLEVFRIMQKPIFNKIFSKDGSLGSTQLMFVGVQMLAWSGFIELTQSGISDTNATVLSSIVIASLVALFHRLGTDDFQSLPIPLANHLLSQVNYIEETYKGGDISFFYNHYLETYFPPEAKVIFEPNLILSQEYTLNEEAISALDRKLVLGEFAPHGFTTEYFTNVTELARIMKEYNIIQVSLEEPRNNKKIAVFCFNLYPLRNSSNGDPLRIAKQEIEDIRYSLEKMHQYTYADYELDCMFTFVIRGHVIKSFTITRNTDIQQLYEELLQVYFYYIQGESYRGYHDNIEPSALTESVAATTSYGHYYISPHYISGKPLLE